MYSISLLCLINFQFLKTIKNFIQLLRKRSEKFGSIEKSLDSEKKTQMAGNRYPRLDDLVQGETTTITCPMCGTDTDDIVAAFPCGHLYCFYCIHKHIDRNLFPHRIYTWCMSCYYELPPPILSFHHPEFPFDLIQISHLEYNIQSSLFPERLSVPAFDGNLPEFVGRRMLEVVGMAVREQGIPLIFTRSQLENLWRRAKLLPYEELPPLRSLDEYLWEMLANETSERFYGFKYYNRLKHTKNCPCNETHCMGRNFRLERNFLFLLAHVIVVWSEWVNDLSSSSRFTPYNEQIQNLVRIILNRFEDQWRQYFHIRYSAAWEREEWELSKIDPDIFD